jgi:putative spermidine/putrescine transport system substrate-binding protein
MHGRWLTGTVVVCALALTVAACGDAGDPPPPADGGSVTTGATDTSSATVLGGSMPTSVGPGEGRLSLVVRPGYAEDGSTDPNDDWVKAFQDETGCTVTSRVAITSDEMVQLMHTGQYDGVAAWGDAATRLVLAGDAAPVNVDLIRSYPDLSGFLKDQPDNTYRGTHYGIPQAWGANLLMWRPDVVQPDPDSWGAVFDPISPYRGKVTAHDDPLSIGDAALYLKATQPDLGITDVYELTAVQFQAAVALATVQRGLVGRYWNDTAELVAAWGAGTAVLGGAWQVAANAINADQGGNGPVQAIMPKEGSTGWSTTWMAYSKARNPNCMYLWMDFITRPAVQAQVAMAVGEAPANPKACETIATTDPTFCSTFHVDDAALAGRVAFARLPLPDCGDDRGATCQGYDAWRQAWQQITG